MTRILMLKGLPASGKSTYAKQLEKQGWLRVNKDDLRLELHDGVWSKKNEKEIIKVRNERIIAALQKGSNVVVDDTNFAPIHGKELSRIAEQHNASFEIKFFDIPLETCIERDKNRTATVGKEVIMGMYNKYLKPAPQKYSFVEGLPKAIMVDIDGTLAHMHNRSPYDWRNVDNDHVDPIVKETVRLYYEADYVVIIMSGRDSVCRPETEEWLIRQHDIRYHHLFMREENDNRKDSVIKLELFEKHVRPNYNIEVVLDDRNQVVDMWRSLGLKVYQVQEGNF